jgi:hypothetical protein
MDGRVLFDVLNTSNGSLSTHDVVSGIGATPNPL